MPDKEVMPLKQIEPIYTVGLTRKEFIALPMEERHRRLKEQAEKFVAEHGYLPDDPCDGHSTMVGHKSTPIKLLGETVLTKLKPYIQKHEHLGVVDFIGVPVELIAELERK